MTGTLYMVATPIGNLEDITARALSVLRDAHTIYCEDTRVAKKLLGRYEIDTPTKSYHQHSGEHKVSEILSLLDDGCDIAVVTDAGTPGISDPGNRLVAQVAAHNSEIAIVPIPGASAVITGLSVSGFPTDSFLFLGFPPHKKGRQKFFQTVADASYTVAFYESCHRIKKCLSELANVLDKKRQICICRELTKKFESVYRGTIDELLMQEIPEKGEFVVIVDRK